ncbi:MAG TPA: DoxX family protein [Candidatus Binataceae bacterium]
MQPLGNTGALAGRILLGAIFVLAAMGKFANPAMMISYMSAHQVSGAIPLLYLSAVIELVCGLMVIVGFRARLAALILFLWLVPVTILIHMHPFDQVNTLKNFAIMGGLLMLASAGAGGYSVDGREAAV